MKIKNNNKQPIKVLIVDDEKTNINLLGTLLEDRNYDLMVATSGKETLIVAEKSMPDLILLDVMMPEMDGYEVYRKLRLLDNFDTTQIIFITALNHEDDIIKGLDLGAIDYITKPFSPKVVKSKVKNIAHLIYVVKDLEAKIERELVQNERMASLGQLVAGFTHDLATPLSVTHDASTYLEEKVKSLRSILQQDEIAEEEVFEKLDQLEESLQLAKKSVIQAESMTGSFKRVSIDQTSQSIRSFEPYQLIDDVIRTLFYKFKHSQIKVNFECDKMLMLNGNPGSVTQIMTNLINNSWQHGFNMGQEPGQININVEQETDETVIIHYRDNGVGMDEETNKRVFERFFTTARQQGGSGIGMYNAASIIKKLGGKIDCQSSPGEGVYFSIQIPTKMPEVRN